MSELLQICLSHRAPCASVVASLSLAPRTRGHDTVLTSDVALTTARGKDELFQTSSDLARCSAQMHQSCVGVQQGGTDRHVRGGAQAATDIKTTTTSVDIQTACDQNDQGLP